jgi:hypothetical protein
VPSFDPITIAKLSPPAKSFLRVFDNFLKCITPVNLHQFDRCNYL